MKRLERVKRLKRQKRKQRKQIQQIQQRQQRKQIQQRPRTQQRLQMQQRLRQGSFTVEASLLVPFLVFLTCMMLILSLYLHDRSVLVSCAAELAGKGAVQKYRSNEDLTGWLENQAEGLIENRLLAFREIGVEVTVKDSEVTVCYRGGTDLLGGLTVQEQETAKRMNPVSFIRRTKLAEDLLNQGRES